MKHAVLYVPGLGDHQRAGQRLAVGIWHLYGVRSELVAMNWNEAEPFEAKLTRLLQRVDYWYEKGYRVSLVGASAGAGAIIHAYAGRPAAIHRVVCICGKLQHPETISPAVYRRNPAFAESMERLPGSLERLSKTARSRIVSIKPLADGSVPPADTVVPGAEGKTIISFGHALSIGLALTVYAPLVIWAARRS